ncbi:hypothetical protein VSR82_39645 [Burkholderia sp. JPY481]|uniref:hypothetical protein n=1 Tax=Paraburkholderia sp. EG304 TaxID=3237015 RepID=UPI00317DE77E
MLIVRAPADEASAILAVSQILNLLVSKLWRAIGGVLDVIWMIIDKIGRPFDSIDRAFDPLLWILLMILGFFAFIPIHPEWSVKAAWIIVLFTSLMRARRPLMLTFGFMVGIPGGLIALLLATLSMPFGADLAMASLLTSISAESTPPGEWTTQHLFAHHDRDPWGLMHGVPYRDPGSLKVIADWIRVRAERTCP